MVNVHKIWKSGVEILMLLPRRKGWRFLLNRSITQSFPEAPAQSPGLPVLVVDRGEEGHGKPREYPVNAPPPLIVHEKGKGVLAELV